MVKVWCWRWCFPFALILTVLVGAVYGGNVTYDGRSLIIDGQHRILFSGSIHYPRSTPQMWPNLVAKAKEGGLDIIQTYVFWNLHEPQQGQYNFRGRRNIVRFIKEIQAQGLYVTLRIGPYIESECTYGSDNEQFKFHMQRFAAKIVNLMKSANLYASQGGPIILSQIENEYGNVEGAFHEKGLSYIRWAAQMAVGLQTGVPWVMCKQDNAPDPVINTCNGMQCGKTFKGPNSPNKPSLWTENWTIFGEVPYIRSAEDIAYNVALFIAKRGSYINYYMSRDELLDLMQYHGGTNFDRIASAFVTTSYYDEAPLDEYAEKWKVYKEVIPSFDDTSLRANTLLDQISTAKDTSDYMWYTFRFIGNSPNGQSILSAYSQGHVLHAFVNGNVVGSAHGSHKNATFVMENKLDLIKGVNNISFLSATVGLPNSGAYLEHKVAGLSRVKVQGRDVTNQAWGYQVGLLGEKLQIYTASGSSKIQWESFQSSTKPLTWYKTTFDAPEGNDPVVLNLASMGKGYTWVNGQGIGRYWVSFITPQGTPSQKWYHIPRSLLKSTGNLLVLLEEETGNPHAITLDTVYITSQ
ncbi:unnamed protein product [Sphenostylis stenocarpa]|uniref:beta-galactosidase n=1 Tax=Sphenostylis stenocarpa TaxID=92480 RepID=A0AA86T4H5_9FABA|nr:unnamed protein product [Sphenostylis stenocarpa]